MRETPEKDSNSVSSRLLYASGLRNEQGEFEKIVAFLPDYLQDVARFAYCTGWRKEEILTLEWMYNRYRIVPERDFREGQMQRHLDAPRAMKLGQSTGTAAI